MALGKRRVEEESEIDLTPMLDVVFIMLIFFIVTASFVKESGLDVNRPPVTNEPPPPSDEQKKNAVFKVTETNDIWLEGRRIDVRSVRANVGRIRAENPEAKVIIQAHPKSKADVFVKIADQSREAGVYDISLSTK
jgi:biopolymer transport protein ExbD